jgi:glycerol-3-phosphate dehydrogenase
MKDLIFPGTVTAFNNIDEAIEGTDYIVLSVPSHVIRSMCKLLKGKIFAKTYENSLGLTLRAKVNILRV